MLPSKIIGRRNLFPTVLGVSATKNSTGLFSAAREQAAKNSTGLFSAAYNLATENRCFQVLQPAPVSTFQSVSYTINTYMTQLTHIYNKHIFTIIRQQSSNTPSLTIIQVLFLKAY
jgi:hypothetical protein